MKKFIWFLLVFFALTGIALAETATNQAYLEKLSKANNLLNNCLPLLANAIAFQINQDIGLRFEAQEQVKEALIAQINEDPYLILALAKYFSSEELAAVASSCGTPHVATAVNKFVELLILDDYGNEGAFSRDFEEIVHRLGEVIEQVKENLEQ